MDPHCGNGEEAMDCILESDESLPKSSMREDLAPHYNDVDNESSKEGKIDDNTLAGTNAITPCTVTATKQNSGAIHQNNDVVTKENDGPAIEEMTCISPGSSTVSPLEEYIDTTSGKCVDKTPEMHDDPAGRMLTDSATNAQYEIVNNDSSGMRVKLDGSSDASCSGIIAEVAKDINTDNESSISCNDAVIGRITVLSINEKRMPGGKVKSDAGSIDVSFACSDPGPDKEIGDNNHEGIHKSEEIGSLKEMKDSFPPVCEMSLQSGKSVQISKKIDSDSHYDSEIEIIDCTSESLDGQPVDGATPSNPSSVVAEFPSDYNISVGKRSGVHSAREQVRVIRSRKQKTSQVRCENLRQFRLKLKSGDLGQSSQTKSSRVSSNSLDKLTKNNLKFMENFDPKMSNRERRKKMRKTNARRYLRGDLYGGNGELMSCGKNLCDCMNPDCPGCHFPCPRCQSPKCGHECRVNRKWTYEEIEIDGTDIVIRPHDIIETFLCEYNDGK